MQAYNILHAHTVQNQQYNANNTNVCNGHCTYKQPKQNYAVSDSNWTIFLILLEVDMSMYLSPISITIPPSKDGSVCIANTHTQNTQQTSQSMKYTTVY